MKLNSNARMIPKTCPLIEWVLSLTNSSAYRSMLQGEYDMRVRRQEWLLLAHGGHFLDRLFF